jgi:hypothetical protein
LTVEPLHGPLAALKLAAELDSELAATPQDNNFSLHV